MPDLAAAWRNATNWLMGYLPFTPELAWAVRSSRGTFGRYNLEKLRAALPEAVAQAGAFAKDAPAGKRIFLFASIHYWVEYSSVLGLALAGQGHRVTFGYFPYADYRKPTTRFDRHYQSYYSRLALAPAAPLLRCVDLLDVPASLSLPPALQQAVEQISVYDTQYVLQVEEVERDSDFYRMRLNYNQRTARALLTWLRSEPPDVVLFPNGIVIEYGVAYAVARYLKLPVITFEFSEEREQVWIAHDDEVMRQNTDALWQAYGKQPLTPTQRRKIEALEQARQSARTFGKSDRLWQDIPPQGKEAVRSALGLDGRPVALLATNVLGDSLILGRNLFCQSMADWILRTIEYFGRHPESQLVVRVHPGERFMSGPSMVDRIAAKFPALPENVRLVGPLEKVNTYDIMSIARLGLAYTTTVGMEMAMGGVPVILAGDTHYRGRGFTLEPASWEEYFQAIQQVLGCGEGAGLSQEQIELAWNYAYRFFFEFPRPFPWKIYGFWEDFKLWPLARILGEEGQSRFGASFRALAGGPIEWTDWDMD